MIGKWRLTRVGGYNPDMATPDEIPRRIRLDRMSPAELAITNAMRSVEEAGAHPFLTDAVNMLAQAREKVADFVDGVATHDSRVLGTWGHAYGDGIADD